MVDVSDVKGRVQQALAEFESNPTQLARKYRVNQKTLNNQINGTTDLSVSTILLILDAFPSVSSDWLLLGVGDMHKLPDGVDSPEDVEIGKMESTIKRLTTLLGEKELRIRELEEMATPNKKMAV